MQEFWNNKFRSKDFIWGNQASDSAIQTAQLFNKLQYNSVLIPGIGYGRNAKPFINLGMNVSGIEIATSAIEQAKAYLGKETIIYSGSVTEMPFNGLAYDGIYCYALIHLLNERDRQKLIQNCFNQLKNGGLMVFVMISEKSTMFGTGEQIGLNRFTLENGINVFFYNKMLAQQEFQNHGLKSIEEIEEPVKFMPNEAPMHFIKVLCEK